MVPAPGDGTPVAEAHQQKEPTNTSGAWRQLEENMLENLRAMFACSDDPAYLRAEVLKRLGGHDRDVFSVIRLGWEKFMDDKRTTQTNMGIVAALVLSVTLSLTLTTLETAQPEEEDRWSAHRQNFACIYFVFLMLSSLSAIVTIILSVLWVNYSLIFVLDADDALWFLKNMPSGATDVGTVLTLVFLLTGVPFGMVVQLEDPAATICFSLAWATMIVMWIWYLTMLFTNIRKAQRTLSRHHTLQTRLVQKAFEDVTSSPMLPQ